MNIYDLRKSIHVYSYNSHSEGCAIFYIIKGKTNALILNNVQLFEELIKISALDEDAGQEEYSDYNLCQWDALSLVIRHELAKEEEKDLQNSDIFGAIANIIKPTK